MGLRQELVKDALATALENYKDDARILSAMDDKAQKIGAIGGLFLAVPFAFAKPESLKFLRDAVGLPGFFLLSAAIVLFIASVGLCLAVMWTRRIPPPLRLVSVDALLSDMLALPEQELTDEICVRYGRERMLIWQNCITAQEAVINRKSGFLFASQVVLGIALLAISTLLLVLIYSAAMFTVPLC